MKKTNKCRPCLLLALALAAVAAFGLTALAAEPDAIIADGVCGGTGDGSNLTWTLTADGTLTVAGEGPTGDYTAEAPAPYAAYRDDIIGVTFTEGVTRVGDYALGGLERLETLSVPVSLESVGGLALDGCFCLQEIRYAGTYDELCAVSQPEELGDLGSVELFTIIRYSPAEWDSPEWTVEDGVLTFSGDGVIPDTALYGNTPWFDLRGGITEVVVPEGVTYVGSFAFAGLENLRVLCLPSTLEGTGEGALVGCGNLEDLRYNGTMEQLAALLENGSVNDPGLPETVLHRLEEILRVNYDEAFNDVDWYIEDAVLHISCNGALPGVVTYKSTPWFDLRDSFHTIVVEEGVTGIGDNALAWLRRVQEVYLPASLSEIGENILQRDDMLYAVYCAFDDEKAEQLALYDHIGVIYTEQDTIEHFYPDQIICLGENVHRFVFEDFSFIGGSERTLLTGYIGDGPDCVLPAAPVDENGETITAYEIAPWAMKDGKWISHVKSYDDSQGYEKGTQSSSVTSLVVPDCVTVIRPQAFLDVRYLQSVTLPDGLETVGDWAFARTQLKSVRLPDSVVHLGDYIFCGADLSEGVRLPAGIESIPKGIFMWSALSSFTVPDTVKTIGFAAFSNCRMLTELHLNDGLEVLDDYAFETAVGLTSMIFPDSVTRIGAYCFQFCSNIEEIVWPRNLERMEFSCFRYCKKLTALILPENVKYIEGLAFDHCESVTEVSLPEGVVFVAGFHPDIYTGIISQYPIQSVFRGCASLKEIVLPASVTDIGAGMFNVCPLLERVSILGDVEYIGPYTFKDCPSLKELFLPASVRHFGLSQFDADRGYTNRYGRVFYGADESNGGFDEFDMPFTGDIYFAGTPEQWAQVDAPKDDLSGARVLFPETRSLDPTCTAHGYRNAVYYSGSDYVIDPGEFLHAWGHSPETVAATEATATEHGYTEGVYCERCHEWLSGHEVIHNTLGERTVLQKPTATQAGECIITCTVCGEQGLYAMEPVTDHDTEPTDPQPGEDDPAEEPVDNSAIGRLRRAMKSIIEFFLRLLKWFGKG